MPGKIKHTVEDGIVRVTLTGKINPEAFPGVTADIANRYYISIPKIKVILDFRRASFKGKPDDLKMIIKKLKEHNRKFEIIKLAIILQNPYETAISIIFQKMANEISNLFINVFSTEQAALSWLA